MENKLKMFAEDGQLLYRGNKVKGCDLSPEAPLFLASAFL